MGEGSEFAKIALVNQMNRQHWEEGSEFAKIALVTQMNRQQGAQLGTVERL